MVWALVVEAVGLVCRPENVQTYVGETMPLTAAVKTVLEWAGLSSRKLFGFAQCALGQSEKIGIGGAQRPSLS